MQEEHGAGFLLCRKRSSLSNPEYLILLSKWKREWSIPKGHKEHNETPLITALRETGEETGIKPDSIQVIDGFEEVIQYKLKKRTRKCPDGLKRVRMFLAKVPYDTKVELGREHISYRWGTLTSLAIVLPVEFQPFLIKANTLAKIQ